MIIKSIKSGILILSLLISTQSKADALDFTKGCMMMGTIGVGGTAVAISSSKTAAKDGTVVMVASGIINCFIGGLLANDAVKKAEMEASQELAIKNSILKNRILGVMHDLCVMKRTCGPDGLPTDTSEKTKSYLINPDTELDAKYNLGVKHRKSSLQSGN